MGIVMSTNSVSLAYRHPIITSCGHSDCSSAVVTLPSFNLWLFDVLLRNADIELNADILQSRVSVLFLFSALV